MTAVSLFAVSLGAPTDGDAAGRTAGDSGSLFGEALTAAGQTLVGAEAESATSPGVEGQSDAAPGDGRPDAASDTSLEGDAASTALLQLTAQLRPVEPGAQSTVDSDEPEEGSDDSLLAAVAGVEVSTAPATEQSLVSVQAEGEPVPAAVVAVAAAVAAVAATPTAGAVAVPVGGTDGDAASSAPALASSTSAPDAPGAQPSPGAQPPGASAERHAPAPSPDVAVASSGVAGAGNNASATNAPSTETSARIESVERVPPSQPAPSTAPVAPPQTSVTSAPPAPAPEAAPANRAVATQVSPVVVSVAQRPMGTHHLTMTVNPESLGPVTVRAHISASGEVQVELSGATDAGRDALRGILVDLRRDLAAVMPHATLSVTQSSATDANGDRNGQGAGAAGDQGSGDRDAHRGRSEQRPDAERGPDLPHLIQTTTSHAGVGAGLDIFA